MAMIRLGVALVGTVISLFLLMQILMTGEDELPAFNAYSSAEDDGIRVSTPEEGLFLLGAGKADITGYGLCAPAISFAIADDLFPKLARLLK